MTIKTLKISLAIFLCSIFIFTIWFAGCTEKKITYIEDVTFTDLEGQTRHLSEFSGKILLLDLMGVNCQPCALQMSQLKKISQNYSSDQVTIISLDVWVKNGETAELLRQYIAAFH
jgi:thiol-disulfide isomerase/thioredoxin